MNQQSAKAAESKIVIQQGDLTEMETDAIVNAANNLIPTAGCMPGFGLVQLSEKCCHAQNQSVARGVLASHYSYRNATSGSTRMARRAGM